MQKRERQEIEIIPERDLVFCQVDGQRINPCKFSTHHRILWRNQEFVACPFIS